jgi:hypothetical protein
LLVGRLWDVMSGATAGLLADLSRDPTAPEGAEDAEGVEDAGVRGAVSAEWAET